MPAFDYSKIYDVYDSYCTFSGDVPFWLDVAARRGDLLELMAGTGRISLPLLEAGIRLTCVERDFGMLSVLAHKVALRHPSANAICADVVALPLRSTFQQIILPFQGLSELAEPKDRETLFRQVAEHLPVGGEFICTAHNPAVRSRTLNGEWQTIGAFPDEVGNTVELSLRGTVDQSKATATGEQRVVVRDGQGLIRREHLLPLRFSLPPLSELMDLAASANLRAVSVFGGYDCSEYEAGSSPAIIVVFQKTA